MLVEEGLGAGELLLLEEARVRAGEQARPVAASDRVADLVADDRRDRAAEDEERERRRHHRRRDEEAGGEEQRVAREEEADEDPGLGEHDQEQPDEPDVADELFGVEPEAGEDHCGILTVVPRSRRRAPRGREIPGRDVGIVSDVGSVAASAVSIDRVGGNQG